MDKALALLNVWDAMGDADPVLCHVFRRALESLPLAEVEAAVDLRMEDCRG